MKYSKYENFSTNLAASETNKAMKKLDEAGKTDNGRKKNLKLLVVWILIDMVKNLHTYYLILNI